MVALFLVFFFFFLVLVFKRTSTLFSIVTTPLLEAFEGKCEICTPTPTLGDLRALGSFQGKDNKAEGEAGPLVLGLDFTCGRE